MIELVEILQKKVKAEQWFADDKNIKEIIQTFDSVFKSEIQEKKKYLSRKREMKLISTLNLNTKIHLIKWFGNIKKQTDLFSRERTISKTQSRQEIRDN